MEGRCAKTIFPLLSMPSSVCSEKSNCCCQRRSWYRVRASRGEEMICPRCLEPRTIAYRAVSDIMDIEVCDDCAIEVWRYDGPIGRLRVIRL